MQTISTVAMTVILVLLAVFLWQRVQAGRGM